MPKKSGAKPRVFKLPTGVSREEVKRTLREEYRTKTGRRKIPARVMAASLALLTGRRRGEIAMLHRGDVHRREKTITRTIEKKKTLRRATLPAGNETFRILRTRYAQRGRPPDNEPVVPGNPRSRSVLFKRRSRKHGRELRFHDLRHLFALRLIGRGAPLPVVKLALQHSSVKVTGLYLELHPDALADRVI